MHTDEKISAIITYVGGSSNIDPITHEKMEILGIILTRGYYRMDLPLIICLYEPSKVNSAELEKLGLQVETYQEECRLFNLNITELKAMTKLIDTSVSKIKRPKKESSTQEKEQKKDSSTREQVQLSRATQELRAELLLLLGDWVNIKDFLYYWHKDADFYVEVYLTALPQSTENFVITKLEERQLTIKAKHPKAMIAAKEIKELFEHESQELRAELLLLLGDWVNIVEFSYDWRQGADFFVKVYRGEIPKSTENFIFTEDSGGLTIKAMHPKAMAAAKEIKELFEQRKQKTTTSREDSKETKESFAQQKSSEYQQKSTPPLEDAQAFQEELLQILGGWNNIKKFSKHRMKGVHFYVEVYHEKFLQSTSHFVFQRHKRGFSLKVNHRKAMAAAEIVRKLFEQRKQKTTTSREDSKETKESFAQQKSSEYQQKSTTSREDTEKENTKPNGIMGTVRPRNFWDIF